LGQMRGCVVYRGPFGVRGSEFGVWTWNLELRTWNWRRADPHQHLPVLINGKSLRLNEFGLQIFERLIIQVELAFQGPIRDALSPLKKRNGLTDHLGELHPACSWGSGTGILYKLTALSKTSWWSAAFPRAASTEACPIALECGQGLSSPGKSLAQRKF